MKSFNWQLDQSSTQTTELNTQIVKFGDGYEQAVSFGINNARQAWNCSVTNTKAVIDEIYRFLIGTKGVEAFSITPVPNEPSIHARQTGSISRSQVGGEIWKISFEIKQVF